MGHLCMFSFPTTSPKYKEINLQETNKQTRKITCNADRSVVRVLPGLCMVSVQKIEFKRL